MAKDYILTESVKYLNVKIDTNLVWHYHVNDLSIKLNRANALLFKIRKYVSLNILRSNFFAVLTPTYPTALLSGPRVVAKGLGKKKKLDVWSLCTFFCIQVCFKLYLKEGVLTEF